MHAHMCKHTRTLLRNDVYKTVPDSVRELQDKLSSFKIVYLTRQGSGGGGGGGACL